MPGFPVPYAPTGNIRLGRDRMLKPSEHVAVNVYETAAAAMRAGADDYGRVLTALDPERVADILGVTDGGRFDGAEVTAVGEKLLTNGLLGVDLLVVPPGAGFPPHIHPGHHLLLCLSGPGTFTLDGTVHPVSPGDLHMVEGGVPHAVGNPHGTPHILLAFGAPPKELDAKDRMTVVDWDGRPVYAEIGEADG